MKALIGAIALVAFAATAAAHPASSACPLMSEPDCWTLRLACYYLDGPLHALVEPNEIFAVGCRTQPGGSGGAHPHDGDAPSPLVSAHLP